MPECVVCEETITQPLCGGCIEQQMETWLFEKGLGSDELNRRTDEILVRDGATQCIKCKQGMSVCGHCYVTHIRAWLQEAHPALEEEFIRLFSIYPESMEVWIRA